MLIKTTCGLLRTALHRVKVAARGNREGVATFIVTNNQFEVQMAGGGSLAKAFFPLESGSEQTIIVNGAKALSVLSTADASSPLEIIFTPKSVRLKFESADIKIAAMDTEAELLTDAVWASGTEIISGMTGKELKHMLGKVTYASAVNDVRFFMNAVHICDIEGKLAMVGTNGAVLSVVRGSVSVTEGTSLLMPIEVGLFLRSLVNDDDLVQVLELRNSDGQNGLGIRTNGFELKTPLVCGVYPNWRKAMPDKGSRTIITAPGKALMTAIERVKLASLGKPGTTGVQITFSDGGICIDEKGGDSFDMVVADTGELSKKDWACSFNPEYLIDSISHIEGNIRLVVDAENSQTALLLLQESDGDNWGGLVMPLKV